jgi:hypothetical protein
VQEFVQIPVAIVAGQTVLVGDSKPVLDNNCWASLLVKTNIIRWEGITGQAGRQAGRQAGWTKQSGITCV